MNIKEILYLLIVPFSIWVVSALKIEHFFKKNHTMQIIVFYLFLSLGISYLVVNFIYDFYEVSRIIK
ncbi:MAG TPA: DUF1146 domain-containing protein [Mollicutes bacterium]|jgi:uncharacterized integral membrane protein (TIGR02327 family)|nr:DUF1146 domain-containing protein [Mollicutes bacterium]